MQSFRCGDIGFTVVLSFKVAETQEGEKGDKQPLSAQKEEKPSALDLLNAAVNKAEKKETGSSTNVEENPSIDQKMSLEEKDVSESIGQEDEAFGLKPLDRLDLALKQFKELS